MSNRFPPYASEKISAMFAQLNQQDVEEFYLAYQYWNLQHQIEILQNQLNQTHRMMIENTERIQQVQPTAIELAILARLQSNGVSDVSLLDQMLERGEFWLDRTMQRLDYLEHLDDFIRDDYTQWCQHALEGAYDWIDSVLDGDATSSTSTENTQATTVDLAEEVKQEELIEATEELFFQKINTEDELLLNEITSKRPAITPPDLEEAIPTAEERDDTLTEVNAPATFENTTPVVDETHPVELFEAAKPSTNEDDTNIESTALEEPISREDSSMSSNEQPYIQEQVKTSAIAQTSSRTSTNVTQEYKPPKRPGMIIRFLVKIWGS